MCLLHIAKKIVILYCYIFQEFAIFSIQPPIEQYFFGAFFDLGLTDICTNRVTGSKFFNRKYYELLRVVSGISAIWIRLSILAVLTLFCTLVWIASLLAEELDKRTNETTFPVEREAYSTALKKWFNQFQLFNVLVERINDLFSPIIALHFLLFSIWFVQLFYNFVNEHNIVNMDIDYVFNPSHGRKKPRRWFIDQIPDWTFILYMRFAIIVIVCHQLQKKVFHYTGMLMLSFTRISFLYFSIMLILSF